MKYRKSKIPEVFIIEPKIFGDSRGYFFESFKKKEFEENIGKINFIQENESKSTYGTLRGLHYQLPPHTQAKLVRVVKGRVLDVAVDIRKGSPTFGNHVSVELTEENKKQIFIPRGFAHGFLTLSKEAIFNYKVDNNYAPDHERVIYFNDPHIKIQWKHPSGKILLSEKDLNAPDLSSAQIFQYSENLYK